MAKLPHRIFEIYESREEAIQVLTPKSERTATDATAPESWEFRHLAVSRLAGVTHVEFKEAQDFGDETVPELRDDFAQLADQLGRDNKVLLDFTGVVLFGSAFINAMALFNKKLRVKGSRIALCCLGPGVRESFFAVG
ncbi:MAG: STAS domain-containing protein [Planctomycetota bacterium]|nr:STAS domain-containing protein [Planctomycetota bacterium]